MGVRCGVWGVTQSSRVAAVLVLLPELGRQHAGGDAAVHLRRLGQLAELDDARVDHVEGGDVPVRLAQVLEVLLHLGVLRGVAAEHGVVPEEGDTGCETWGLGRAPIAEHGVVLDEHGPGVQPRADELLLGERRQLLLRQLSVAAAALVVERLDRLRLPRDEERGGEVEEAGVVEVAVEEAVVEVEVGVAAHSPAAASAASRRAPPSCRRRRPRASAPSGTRRPTPRRPASPACPACRRARCPTTSGGSSSRASPSAPPSTARDGGRR